MLGVWASVLMMSWPTLCVPASPAHNSKAVELAPALFLGMCVGPVLLGYPGTEDSFMRPNPRLDVEFVPLSERELVPA